MKRIKDILLMAVTAGMASQHLLLREDLDVEGVGLEHQFAAGLLDRHGVAIGLVDHLAVGGQMYLARHTAVERARGQGAQQGLLGLPHLANALRLPIDDAHIVTLALLLEEVIEVLKGGHARQWYQEIAATEAHRALHPSLLMPLRWGTVM